MGWLSRREDRQRTERAMEVYRRAPQMRQEIVTLTEANRTLDDIQVCLGCCELVLRGHENKHIAKHARNHAYQPIGWVGPMGWTA